MTLPWSNGDECMAWLESKGLTKQFKAILSGYEASLSKDDAMKFATADIVKIESGEKDYAGVTNGAKELAESKAASGTKEEMTERGDSAPDSTGTAPEFKQATAEDFDWALQNSAYEKVAKKSAPSAAAWSMWKHCRGVSGEAIIKNLMSIVAKNNFGKRDDDAEDDRAIEAAGLPKAFREMFRKVHGKAGKLLAGELAGI